MSPIVNVALSGEGTLDQPGTTHGGATTLYGQ